ncbi:hypothetical protein [Halosimplex halophilum]|uniref:hypothetical protein n=1 Tax=Halosimplex halophilum TaxID=2559572 RepID=UPI00107F8F79|nr:hypothetical protein [Halosimplex halophilum]
MTLRCRLLGCSMDRIDEEPLTGRHLLARCRCSRCSDERTAVERVDHQAEPARTTVTTVGEAA